MLGESTHSSGQPSSLGVIPKVESKVNEDSAPVESKRARTSEDFYLFCKYVLDYENYDEVKKEEVRYKASSPLGSTGSGSLKSETSGSPRGQKPDSDDETHESRESVTCFCNKPFAGRPMIQCDHCLTWLHLSCVKIKKSQIPDLFYCVKCQKEDPTLSQHSNLQSNNNTTTKSRVRKRTNSQIEA